MTRYKRRRRTNQVVLVIVHENTENSSLHKRVVYRLKIAPVNKDHPSKQKILRKQGEDRKKIVEHALKRTEAQIKYQKKFIFHTFLNPETFLNALAVMPKSKHIETEKIKKSDGHSGKSSRAPQKTPGFTRFVNDAEKCSNYAPPVYLPGRNRKRVAVL